MSKKAKFDWKHEIKVLQGYICPVCGLKGTDSTLQIHHCKNKCRGGDNSISNCVAVHDKCHKSIHQKYGNDYYDPRQG